MTREEDMEFEDYSKKMRTLWLKKSLREQGIDTIKIPQYKIDEIRRALDKNDQIQQKYQPKFKQLQDDYQAATNKLNTEMQAEVMDARSEVDKLIQQIKTDQGIRQQPKIEQAESTEENKQEPEKEIIS